MDDTLALVRDQSDATDFLTTLNDSHPSIRFTMEVATNNCLPFIGTEIINTGQHLETCVFRKNTNKDLLLHFQSHGDGRLKRPLLKTMLDRAKRLSSTQDFFLQECNTLKGIFLKLKYPKKVIESAINSAQHPRDMNYTPTVAPLGLPCPTKIRNLPANLGDSWATSEGRSITLCSQSLQAKRSSIIYEKRN